MHNHFMKLAGAIFVFGLSGCQPTDKPVNLANTKAIEKAKAVEGQLQQRAAEPRKAEEEPQK
jgi:hypothetical protein